MRIAFVQMDSVLGNVEKNLQQILAFTERAKDKRAEVVIFPELSLLGYMPQDLLDREDLVKEQERAIQTILKKIPNDIAVILGCVRFSKGKHKYSNSAAVLQKKKKIFYADKTLFPSYDVFDETRYFNPGNPEKNIVTIRGKKILLTVCEDLWVFDKKTASRYQNPFGIVKKKKIDIVVNISASPFTKEKIKDRLALCKNASAYFKAPLIYVNQVGAQDELIFDGKSFAIDKNRKLLTESLAFQEDLNVVDFQKQEGGKRHQLKQNVYEDLRKALVLGIRDFVAKTGFKKVHLGLSGGIDSALVACLAADALGPNNVHAIALPTKFNATESLDLAKQLAHNLGISFQSLPIENIFQTVKGDIDSAYKVESFGLVHENLQSRLRGLLLMAYSNHTGSMLLATGNKSEFAMGYSTLYGDMCGGLAPIGDLLKTEVFELSKLYNQDAELIPVRIIDRPPSAELRPNQKDQDSLPPYEELDPMIEKVVNENRSAKSEKEKWVLEKIYKSEFKRRQAPPILKVSNRSFGVGRRYPIAHQAKL